MLNAKRRAKRDDEMERVKAAAAPAPLPFPLPARSRALKPIRRALTDCRGGSSSRSRGGRSCCCGSVSLSRAGFVLRSWRWRWSSSPGNLEQRTHTCFWVIYLEELLFQIFWASKRSTMLCTLPLPHDRAARPTRLPAPAQCDATK